MEPLAGCVAFVPTQFAQAALTAKLRSLGAEVGRLSNQTTHIIYSRQDKGVGGDEELRHLFDRAKKVCLLCDRGGGTRSCGPICGVLTAGAAWRSIRC